MRAVDVPFDLVVSTNGGVPPDRNLYQAVKGMAAAERIVRPGGIIVMAAACEDGVPAGGAFACLLAEALARRPSWSAPRECPSSTAGRPRCSDVCAARSKCASDADGLDEHRGHRGALLTAASDLDGAVAAGWSASAPGRGWPSSRRAPSPSCDGAAARLRLVSRLHNRA